MINFLENNFWKEFPELTLAPILAEEYKEDTSKGKQKSSLLLWAIHLCESPNSKFFNHPEKYEVIAEKVLKEPKFKWKQKDKVVESYRNFVLTDAERALSIWNETMSLRNSSLKEMYQEAFDEKDTDELVKLDKMLSNTPKMFDDYKKIRRDFEDEKLQKGGKKKQSLSDADEI